MRVAFRQFSSTVRSGASEGEGEEEGEEGEEGEEAHSARSVRAVDNIDDIPQEVRSTCA